MTLHDLPAVNASLNALSALLLALGFVFIRRGNKTAHRNCMVAAFTTSIIFLGCYLTYHIGLSYYYHQPVTRFENPAWWFTFSSTKSSRSICPPRSLNNPAAPGKIPPFPSA